MLYTGSSVCGLLGGLGKISFSSGMIMDGRFKETAF